MGGSSHFQRAVELAARARTHPNPMVGCVVVDDDGRTLGEGFHAGPGTDHAEVVALGQAGSAAAGSTMYVTLEPCSHVGRTAPCVDAIVAAGVSHVVVGAIDPDPKVFGRGVSALEAAGISVEAPAYPEAGRAVDPSYFHQRETGLPTVTLKYAMTLDGSVAAADFSSKWITGEQARADSHLLRREMDAVVVGAGTMRADDPSLNVRHVETNHQPRPIIISGRGDLPGTLAIWGRNPLVVAPSPLSIPAGDTLIVESSEGLPVPEAAARAIADAGYYDLLLEGGPTLSGAWWRAGLINRGVAYIGGKIGGGTGVQPLGGFFEAIDDAGGVEIRDVRRVGEDLRVEFE